VACSIAWRSSATYSGIGVTSRKYHGAVIEYFARRSFWLSWGIVHDASLELLSPFPIFTMKRIALLLVLVIGLAVTSVARSQQPATKVPPAGSKAQARDSVLFKPSPELQKALDDLAAAMQALAARIASDPEIKAAAMQVASGVVTTAQQVVAEQSVAIEGALKTAAERISASQSNPRPHSKKP